jgi:hypothetical protein
MKQEHQQQIMKQQLQVTHLHRNQIMQQQHHRLVQLLNGKQVIDV